jgi:hypothetical protein
MRRKSGRVRPALYPSHGDNRLLWVSLVCGRMPSQCHLVFPKLVSDVGRTPWSAADALVGLELLHEPDFLGERAGPGGPARTRGSAPRLSNLPYTSD